MWQASELLRNQHLQPYVLKIHQKINTPRRNSLPSTYWPETEYVKKTRFAVSEVPRATYREKRLSYSNDRTLNPSISLHDDESPVYGRRVQNTPRFFRQGVSALSSGNEHGETVISKSFAKKPSVVTRSPGYSKKKASGPPKRAELTKKLEPVRSGKSNHKLLFLI